MGNDSSHEEEEEEEPKLGSLTGRPISRPVRHVQIHKVHFDVPSKKWKRIRSGASGASAGNRRSSEATHSREHHGYVKLICKDFILHKPYIGDMYFYHLYYETPKKEVHDIQGYYLPNRNGAIDWFFQDVFIYGLVVTGDGLDFYIQVQIDAHIDNIENQLLLEEKNGEGVSSVVGGVTAGGAVGGGARGTSSRLVGIELKSVVEVKNVRQHAQSMGFAGIAARNMKQEKNSIIIDEEDIIGNPIPVTTPTGMMIPTPTPVATTNTLLNVDVEAPIGSSLTLDIAPSLSVVAKGGAEGVDPQAGLKVEDKKTDFSESADGSVEVVVDKANE